MTAMTNLGGVGVVAAMGVAEVVVTTSLRLVVVGWARYEGTWNQAVVLLHLDLQQNLDVSCEEPHSQQNTCLAKSLGLVVAYGSKASRLKDCVKHLYLNENKRDAHFNSQYTLLLVQRVDNMEF